MTSERPDYVVVVKRVQPIEPITSWCSPEGRQLILVIALFSNAFLLAASWIVYQANSFLFPLAIVITCILPVTICLLVRQCIIVKKLTAEIEAGSAMAEAEEGRSHPANSAQIATITGDGRVIWTPGIAPGVNTPEFLGSTLPPPQCEQMTTGLKPTTTETGLPYVAEPTQFDAQMKTGIEASAMETGFPDASPPSYFDVQTTA